VGHNREVARRILGVIGIAIVVGSGALTQSVLSQPRADATAADEIPPVAVSRQLLDAQGLAVGDIVSLSREPNGAHARSFRVVGVYEPMPDPLKLGAARHEIRMHLPDLVAMSADPAETGRVDPLDVETVDAINVQLPDPRSGEAFARELNTTLPGIVVHPIGSDDQRAAPFVVLERFHLAIAIVTVFASSIFLLALMLMLVDERRDVVGILRLIGYRRRRILAYVLVEGLVLAVAGAAIGILLAAGFQDAINRFFQWRYDTLLVFVRITPRIALRSIVIAVPLGVAAATAASWSLLRRQGLIGVRR
jgi:predicted lysophospholipase L1 biosynthesis ABC-type transport system permease subunit